MFKKISKCDIALVLITIVFTLFVYLFHQQTTNVSLYNFTSLDYVKARVIEVVEEQTKPDSNSKDRYYGVQSLHAEILEGKRKGEKVYIDNYLTTTHNVRVHTGETFIACIDHPDQANSLVTVYNYYRTPYSYGLIALLIVIVILIGNGKGIRTVISLIFTLFAIVSLLLPMIFQGYSPVLSTIMTLILTIGYSLFMLNGYSIKTWVALLSTILGVIMSGLCFQLMSSFIHISGYNVDQAEALILISQQTGLKINEILFSGILISSLGAVMDVGMSMASSLYEVKCLNPDLTSKEIFQSGIHIGRDMIGTMCNTLILAFTGSSMTILITFLAYQIQYHQLMNSDFMAIEISQGIAGTIGIVLTVPIGALLSSYLYTRHWKHKKTIMNEETVTSDK